MRFGVAKVAFALIGPWNATLPLASKTVTFIEGTYFVVGTSGTVLGSSNLTSWSQPGTLTKKALYGVATDGKQLVSVGVEGAIVRAQVVPDLTPVAILGYDRISGTNLAQNVVLFGGKADQRFTLDNRLAFNTNLWATGAQLEFFDRSGTFYYFETQPKSNAPPQQYYRGTLTP